MTPADLRKKTDVELRELLADLQNQYFYRRFTSDPKRIQNPGRFKAMKADIARILTILRERELEKKSTAAAAVAAVAAEKAAGEAAAKADVEAATATAAAKSAD